MTPKSLLRHLKVVSSLDELSKEYFERVIDDNVAKADKVTKVVLCNGKVYYDLMAKKFDKHENTAVIRIEELYPTPREDIGKILAKYKKAKQVIWLQEEPQNKGAWYHIRGKLEKLIDATKQTLLCVARERSSTPAVGYHALYVKQQEQLVNRVLDI